MAAGPGPHEGLERVATKDDAYEAAALRLDAYHVDVDGCRTSPLPRSLRALEPDGIAHPCWERIV